VTTQAFVPPQDEVLKLKRERFLKESRPALYQELKKSPGGQQLRVHLNQKAHAARSEAEALIQSGAFPPDAWDRAVRQELFDSVADCPRCQQSRTVKV